MIPSPHSILKNAKVSLLDLQINKFSDSDVVRVVTDSIRTGKHFVIAHHNLHSLYLWYHEPQMRAFYALADFIHIDGMSLVLLGNLTGLRLKREHRAATLDFFPLLAPQAVRHGWRIFYLGSRPGVGEKAAARLRRLHPGLQIQTRSGYFNVAKTGNENQEVLAEINAYAPHILIVGMGMPRQEIWILENQMNVNANAILPVGGFMDYTAGEVPTAPRWLASLYLEWLYRLISEPRRLWRRYLVEPWFVLGQVLKHSFKIKSAELAAQDWQDD